MQKYKWPLMDSHFTWLDRLKICSFFLNPNNFWTQNKYVFELEQNWAKFVGSKYCVMVSNGSLANTLLAQVYKDLNSKKIKNKNNVVFASTTWQTNISPWIREGFNPIFCDINKDNLCIDPVNLNKILKTNRKICAVFVTSLIGMSPDFDEIEQICGKYNVDLFFDNCESSFTCNKHNQNLSSKYTSTTSLYIGHLSTTGSEGGLIFTNNEKEYQYYLSYRSHGMIRQLEEEKYNLVPINDFKQNPLVDKKFTFNRLGNNYRSTDIQAFLGLLDFKRTPYYIERRIKLSKLFYDILLPTKYKICPPINYNVPFCLPIISNNSNSKLINKAKKFCDDNLIEWRPIISGNILRNYCYKKYANYKDFKNSEYIHNFGFYVGLYPKLLENNVYWLAEELNKL